MLFPAGQPAVAMGEVTELEAIRTAHAEEVKKPGARLVEITKDMGGVPVDFLSGDCPKHED